MLVLRREDPSPKTLTNIQDELLVALPDLLQQESGSIRVTVHGTSHFQVSLRVDQQTAISGSGFTVSPTQQDNTGTNLHFDFEVGADFFEPIGQFSIDVEDLNHPTADPTYDVSVSRSGG